MCKYCEYDISDNVGPDIIKEEIDMGKLDNIEVSVSIDNDDNGKYYLCLYSSGVNNSNEYIYKNIEIHYCPFCGRKLEIESK